MIVDTSSMTLIEHTVKTVTQDEDQKVILVEKLVDERPKKKTKKSIDDMNMWELFWYYLIFQHSR